MEIYLNNLKKIRPNISENSVEIILGLENNLNYEKNKEQTDECN